MATTKHKLILPEVSMRRDDFCVIKKGLKHGGFSIEIGGMDADIEQCISPAMRKELKKIGARLMAQLGCDGIMFNTIGFSRLWKKK